MSTLALQGAPRRRRDFAPKSRFGPVAIGVMVAFHGLLGYALVSGLGKQVVEIVKKPLDATIIQEVKLPPPPPPPEPPPKQIVKEMPKLAPPPPAYVPPPDVAPPPAIETAPAISAVQTSEPAPPPPPAPVVAEAPPAPPAPQRQDIAVACPKQARPAFPERALDDGINGTVRAEVRIRGTRVVDVRIVSGPKVFHAAVRAALAQYQCQTSGGEEILASQDFEFKAE